MIRQYSGEDLEKVLVYYGVINASPVSKMNIICPFHGDTSPSMSVDLAKGKFYCFGCGAHGDAYDFVKLVHPEYSDLNVVLEIEKIIRSKKIQKIQFQKKEAKKINRKQALAEAVDYYYGLSEMDWNHVQDLKGEEIIGYMKKRGFSRCDLNVADCRITSNKKYPMIFPILDNGAFKGWVCRTMDKDAEAGAKYLYNKGFWKRGTLCGTYEENNIVFVCEGFLDYLSLKTRGGIHNVVALLGWHISDIQIEKLKGKGVKQVVCALDNPCIDKSGKKGLELLSKHFKTVPFFYPKNKKDAGDMTKQEIKESVRRIKKRYDIVL